MKYGFNELLKLGFTHNMVVSLLGFLSVTFIFISVLFNDKENTYL